MTSGNIRVNVALKEFSKCECCKPELIKIKKLEQRKLSFKTTFIFIGNEYHIRMEV